MRLIYIQYNQLQSLITEIINVQQTRTEKVESLLELFERSDELPAEAEADVVLQQYALQKREAHSQQDAKPRIIVNSRIKAEIPAVSSSHTLEAHEVPIEDDLFP